MFFSSILLFRIAYEKNLACVGVGKTAKESGVLQYESIRKEAHSGDEQESGAIRGCVTEQHTLRKNALCQKKDAREDERCIPNGVCGGLFPVLLVLSISFSLKFLVHIVDTSTMGSGERMLSRLSD